MYTLQFPIPSSIPISTVNTNSVDVAMDKVVNHTSLAAYAFKLYQKGTDLIVRADDFPTIYKVHTVIVDLFPNDELVDNDFPEREITKRNASGASASKNTSNPVDSSKKSYAQRASSTSQSADTRPSGYSSAKSSSSSRTKSGGDSHKDSKSKKVDSTGKSSPVVVKKPIHPDIVSHKLIARTIGNRGCFMRDIQDKMGANNVQRISVGDKVDNYFYTIYASSQQWADDTYVALQKHEFDIIKECIPSYQPHPHDSDSDSDTEPLDDDFPISDKPDKVYPPGTSWADMLDDDDC